MQSSEPHLLNVWPDFIISFGGQKRVPVCFLTAEIEHVRTVECTASPSKHTQHRGNKQYIGTIFDHKQGQACWSEEKRGAPADTTEHNIVVQTAPDFIHPVNLLMGPDLISDYASKD
jgi:hypothetical protein